VEGNKKGEQSPITRPIKRKLLALVLRAPGERKKGSERGAVEINKKKGVGGGLGLKKYVRGTYS